MFIYNTSTKELKYGKDFSRLLHSTFTGIKATRISHKSSAVYCVPFADVSYIVCHDINTLTDFVDSNPEELKELSWKGYGVLANIGDRAPILKRIWEAMGDSPLTVPVIEKPHHSKFFPVSSL